MTPNLAYGYNAAFQDAVSLTNQLHKLTKSNPKGDHKSPSPAEIEKAFADYQSERYDLAKDDMRQSAVNTRMCAWETTAMKYISKIVANILPLSRIMKQGYGHAKRGRCLEFLNKPEHDGMRFDDEVEPLELKRKSARATWLVALSLVAMLLAGHWFTKVMKAGS
jgi:hypothetical protein